MAGVCTEDTLKVLNKTHLSELFIKTKLNELIN